MTKPFDQFVADHDLHDLSHREQQELYAQYLDSAGDAYDQLAEDQEAYGN
jgi:hypothetical protein